MRASLPMYERAETRDAQNRYWQAIAHHLRDRGIQAPEHLTPGGAGDKFWTAPDLIFSQTCGLPFRARLHDKVHLVGTPDFGLEDCPPGYYRSAIVVRVDERRDELADFDGAIFAFNASDSQSGYASIYNHPASLKVRFSASCETGAHMASASAIVNRRADLAAIDSQTWRLICRHDSFAAGLRVLEWTQPTPGLPYVCSRSFDPDEIFTAVDEAIRTLDQKDRDALCLRRLVRIPKEDYLAVPLP